MVMLVDNFEAVACVCALCEAKRREANALASVSFPDTAPLPWLCSRRRCGEPAVAAMVDQCERHADPKLAGPVSA
jgi:hypothetical protein